MENLIVLFKQAIHRMQISGKEKLLLAVSGGMDSVVLVHCCIAANLEFGIAHANFQLRGAESERDEAFVRGLASTHDRPFYTRKFNTAEYAQATHCSIQVAARDLRYAWFQTLMEPSGSGFSYVVTAHHLDDNIETMLMHFFRGTGIHGLTGIPEKNERRIRPLLKISKNILRTYALQQGLVWVEDSSNASEDYTRNFFRNNLLPSLVAVYPDIRRNMENNLGRFSEADLVYRQMIAVYKSKLLKPVGAEMYISILLLQKTVPLRTVVFELLKDYGFSPAQTDDVITLMEGSNGKQISGPTHRVIKNRKWLIVAPAASEESAHLVIEETDARIGYPEGSLTLRTGTTASMPVSAERETAFFDAGKIHFPLLLRKAKSGDYFYPLGMTKKKKIARFLIDQKLSKTAKEKIWVLVMNNHIIWVAGHRIDNRFRVTEATENILSVRSVQSPATAKNAGAGAHS